MSRKVVKLTVERFDEVSEVVEGPDLGALVTGPQGHLAIFQGIEPVLWVNYGSWASCRFEYESDGGAG